MSPDCCYCLIKNTPVFWHRLGDKSCVCFLTQWLCIDTTVFGIFGLPDLWFFCKYIVQLTLLFPSYWWHGLHANGSLNAAGWCAVCYPEHQERVTLRPTTTTTTKQDVLRNQVPTLLCSSDLWVTSFRSHPCVLEGTGCVFLVFVEPNQAAFDLWLWLCCSPLLCTVLYTLLFAFENMLLHSLCPFSVWDSVFREW